MMTATAMPELTNPDDAPFDLAQNPEPVAAEPEPVDPSAKSIDQMLKDLKKIERDIARHTEAMQAAAERRDDAQLAHAALRGRLAEALRA